MDPVTLIVAALAAASSGVAYGAVRVIWAALRRPILLGALILAFVVSAVVCLVVSGLVFRGWWQGFFQNVGVSLLFIGVVNLGILGALRNLIEGEPAKPDRAAGQYRSADAEGGMSVVERLQDVVDRLEQRLADLGAGPTAPH
jgi:hypothetical protein